VGSHAAVSAVILVDNSSSMGQQVPDGTLFDLARKRTGELLASLGPADQVCIIPLSRAYDEPPTVFGSVAAARKRLDRLALSGSPADMQTAGKAARRLLDEAASLNRELYIVTDRQNNTLPAQPVFSDLNTKIYLVDLPLTGSDNRSVIAVNLGGQLIQPGIDFDITATIKNYDNEPTEDLIASCFLDGRRVAQVGFHIDASAETTVRFTRSVSRGGFHSGFVEISDDAFPADNRQYFSFNIPERFNLLLVDADEASQLIRLALAPTDMNRQNWTVKTAAPDELAGIDFFDYDVLMLVGAPNLTETYFNRVREFARRGRSVFVAYGAQTDIAAFNRLYTPLTGVQYDEPVRRQFSRAGYYAVQSFDLDHPIFSIFSFKNNEPPKLKFYTLPRMHIVDSSRVLMWFTGNRPALVEKHVGAGRVLTFTGPLAPDYTDLPSHAFFVPFISRIAEHLASGLSSLDLDLYTGRPIVRSLVFTGAVVDPIEMITPDSSRFFIVPKENQDALVVNARPTDFPGLYHLRYRGREIDRFAVNLEPDESDLAAVDPEQFATALGADAYVLLSAGSSVAAEIATARVGKELWPVFMWIAIILLAVEMILGRGAASKE